MWQVCKDFAGAFMEALAAAPAQTLVPQTGIVTKRLGHSCNGSIDAAGEGSQRHARFTEDTVSGIDTAPHALRGAALTVPQQPVEARDVIFGG